MDGMKAKPYNFTLSFVRALEKDTNNVVMGYLFLNDKGSFIYDFAGQPTCPIEINPYTVCRNSGIKDKNKKFVFEYDLLKLSNYFGQDEEYGFLVWDEFYGKWKIRRFTEFSGSCDVEKFSIEAVGNIVLYDKDAEIIYKQDKAEKEREIIIDRSYCPSCFKK